MSGSTRFLIYVAYSYNNIVLTYYTIVELEVQ